jgi:cytochrome c oxidase assembly protein subunit 15
MARGSRAFELLAAVSFAAVYVTILLGGNVIVSGSGLGCSSWPTCNGSPFDTPFTGSAGIEFSHRLSALVLGSLVALLALVGLLYEKDRPVLRRLAYISFLLVGAEALLGGVVIETSLAPVIVLLHFLLATVLFGLLLVLALLANRHRIPPHWRDWARRASEPGAPATDPGTVGETPPKVAPSTPDGAY